MLCLDATSTAAARKVCTYNRENAFENALDLLADGIALLRHDGRIVYVNEALRVLAASCQDFRVDRGAIEFSTPDLRGRFAAALSAVERVQDPSAAASPTDFAVSRDHGLPAYTVSVRPLLRDRNRMTDNPDVVAMLLVHDPLHRNSAALQMLKELFGLTNAEAHLVHALGTGMTAVAYARSRSVSITTVYTHLRRTREKTGWKSVAELTRRFNELNVALRANQPHCTFTPARGFRTRHRSSAWRRTAATWCPSYGPAACRPSPWR
jgi:DNA-binding CsgD family transcriptional regulator